MVVLFRAAICQFKPGDAIAEIDTDDHPHLFQSLQVAIDGGQITFFLAQTRVNLLVGQWMLVSAQDFQNRLPRSGDFARATTELISQLHQRGLDESAGMGWMIAAILHWTSQIFDPERT